MNHLQIKKKFLDYYIERDHHLLPDASLIPSEYDPSGLFINSGMHTIKPFFYGTQSPENTKLCSSQKCIRTVDIERVGYNARTLTFFNMLGNWSINDYWKEENIPWALDLLVNGFALEKDSIWVTFFKGDDNIPVDTETRDIWKKIGIPESRIIGLDADDNLWSAGPVGLCGPCTEVYYDRGPKYGCGDEKCMPSCDCDRFMEIYNAGVFIQYDRKSDGSFEKLKLRSIDTGAGIERLATVIQEKSSVYETTSLYPIVQEIIKASSKGVPCISSENKNVRIMADHLRTIAYLFAENVTPSNVERGYVHRRLIRRAITSSASLEIQKEGVISILEKAVENSSSEHEYLSEKRDIIIDGLSAEYSRFAKTLSKARKKLMRELDSVSRNGGTFLDSEIAFQMFATFGLPFEITEQICSDQGISVSQATFDELRSQHQKISKKGSEQRFSSGLIDDSAESARYHTATHLLYQALRDVLGNHIQQKGSNITHERLRFDFSYPEKLTPEQISGIENIVNLKIQEGLPVSKETRPLDKARQLGAIGLFEEKYGDEVTVYSIGNYSREICTGPHVRNTSEIGRFKIQKEESSSSGTRRIKAVIEQATGK